MKNYGWNLDSPPDYDLCTRRPSGYYDVMDGVDGWTVKTPFACWAYDRRGWVYGTFAAPPRGIPGAVTRDEARIFAEKLIDAAERR